MEPLDSKCLGEMVCILEKYHSVGGRYWIRLIADLRDLDETSDAFLEKASSGNIWKALLDQYLITEHKKVSREELLEDERKFRVEMAKLGEYLLQFQYKSPQDPGRIFNRDLIQHTIWGWEDRDLM